MHNVEKGPCQKRRISTWLILASGNIFTFQFPLLIHNQSNSVSIEDMMDEVEDTILSLPLFRKRTKDHCLMDKEKKKKFWVRPIFRERKLKENSICFFCTWSYFTQSISFSSFQWLLLSLKNFWVQLHQKLKFKCQALANWF